MTKTELFTEITGKRLWALRLYQFAIMPIVLLIHVFQLGQVVGLTDLNIRIICDAIIVSLICVSWVTLAGYGKLGFACNITLQIFYCLSQAFIVLIRIANIPDFANFVPQFGRGGPLYTEPINEYILHIAFYNFHTGLLICLIVAVLLSAINLLNINLLFCKSEDYFLDLFNLKIDGKF